MLKMNLNNNHPLLSIVIPVFNHPDLVKVMIDSILANEFTDWELLVVDDGSDASTLSFLNNLTLSDTRICLLQRSELPKGAPTCRNIGMNAAHGNYIVFFDSDDYVTPQCLGQRVQAITQHPEFDFMVFPSGLYIDHKFVPDANEYVYGYPIYTDDLKAFAKRLLPFIGWSCIYRLSSLRSHGIRWDTQLRSLQDADFNVRVLLAGLKYDYAHCPPDYGYRINGNTQSISKKIVTEEHFRSNFYAIERYYQLFQSAFGNQYNRALYNGVLYIYRSVFENGLSPDFARQIADIVKQYSPGYGRLLQVQVESSLFLRRFLSEKLARQIPIIPYLIRFRYHLKCFLPCKLRKYKNS